MTENQIKLRLPSNIKNLYDDNKLKVPEVFKYECNQAYIMLQTTRL